MVPPSPEKTMTREATEERIGEMSLGTRSIYSKEMKP
jgi:hypothetical protein